MGSAAEKTRTENHVAIAGKNGLEQRSIIAWAVFEVGVLHENDVAGCCGKTSAQGGSLPAICRLIDDLIGQTGNFFFEDVDRSISRAIVDDNDFDILDGRIAHRVHDL